MSLRCFLTVCFFTSCLGATTKYELLGQEVTFTTGINDLHNDILWTHNGNKVVEFNGNTETQYESFKGRVTLDWLSADLNISNLKYEDSGSYELQIFLGQKFKNIQYELKVIEKLAKPTIFCEMSNGSGTNKPAVQGTLTCSAKSNQSQSLLKFNWISNGKMQPGPKLTIPLGDEHDSEVYNCTVSNPLTKEFTTFIANKCYPDKSFSVALIAGLSASISLLVLILVIVGLCLLCRRGREKTHNIEKQSPLDGAEEFSEFGHGGEERQVLLDRAPTLPSQQTLGHLIKNKGFDSTKHGSEDKNQSLRTSPSFPVPEKPPRTLDRPTNDKKHVDEEEHREPVKDTPADPEETDENVFDEHSSEEKKMTSSPLLKKEQADEDESGEAAEKETLERDPPDSEKTNDAASDDHNSAKNKGSSNPPPVSEKSDFVKESVKKLKAEADKNRPSDAVGKNTSENLDPGTSQKPNSKLPSELENHNSEKNKGSSNPRTVSEKSESVKEPLQKLKAEADENRPSYAVEKNTSENLDPGTPQKPNNELPSESENHNSEKNKRSSNPPLVPKKPNLVKKSFEKTKANADENRPLDAVEKNTSDELNPATSQKPNNKLPSESENHNNKEEVAKPGDDAGPQPVPKPRKSSSQNFPDLSQKEEQKQDASSDHAAGEPAEKSAGECDQLESREAVKDVQEQHS